jgi:hypothetical protein
MSTTTRPIKEARDVFNLVQLMKERQKPFTVTIEDGIKRSNRQNDLSFKWYPEAAAQLGDGTADEKRGWCKLHIGVPILYAENEAWRDQYKATVKPLPYESKLLMMQAPIDFPVTSKMTTKQFTAYLDAVRVHFESLGVVLTVPVSA